MPVHLEVAPCPVPSKKSDEPDLPKEESCKQPFVMRWLTSLTVSGCVLGLLVGLLCQSAEAKPVMQLVQLPGSLFIRALKATVVPMIFASMITNAAALGDKGSAQSMVRMAVKFYVSTTFVAALEGLIIFNLFSFSFHPLTPSTTKGASTVTASPPGSSTIMDTLMKFASDIVPDNIFLAFLEMKLLGVITFAIFFGAMLSKTPGGQNVIQLFSTCFDALVEMIRAIILFTPLGVGSLVAGSVANSTDLGSTMSNIGKLLAVVLFGQAVHVFGFYGCAYFAVTRRNPFKYFSGMANMWMVAFGTSSSAATLSTTCRTCEKLGVSKRTINFVCPIGCTVNMDGSALERPIVVLWIAHMAMQPLPLHRQLLLALISSLMSMGASPIPSAGVSTLLLMVEAAGVSITPTVQLLAGFVLAIEWLFDSVRTAVNVTGDAVGVAIIDFQVKDRREPVDVEEVSLTD